MRPDATGLNMSPGRLLVIGGSGYFGRQLLHHVAAVYAPKDFAYTWYSNDPLALPQAQRLDVRRAEDVGDFVARFQPSALIHLAGSNTTPDMTAVITRGTRHVGRAAASVGARLIHMSTDAIFDGDYAPYDETAPPMPINAYGRAKAEAEMIVAQDYANSVIIRTSLIYGLQEMDSSTSWMATALHAGEPVTLFTNQRRSPVWADSLARGCLELVDPATAAYDFTGILNVAGRQTLSRAEFGLRMLDYWGVGERGSLRLGLDESGRWPLNCELDVSLALRVLQTPMPGVDEVLEQQRMEHG